ncbi:Ger(x)C family spore germination protein [Paenibacillus sp.]|uniref:Ger(x)C family spore germination protein n=1 Tax=Paenibacillus sp. TaxID=58172 RepID=UPI0028117262|nr:Ger(x)C family spore germination protein [Paenibacillus sp.]
MAGFGKSALALSFLLMLLTGCWDIKDLQEINYLTAIGYDLQDDEFVVYGQLLDFASVAKSETGKSGQAPVWVGIGRGPTLVHAIEDLYRSSQLRIFYGHVNAVVIGEKVLKDSNAMKQVYEFQGRYYELRYTPWIFGTSKPIDKIFSTSSIFNFSPAVSVLHQPLETYKQNSVVRPMSVRRFTLEAKEPGRTTLMPSIALSENNWRKGDKPQDMLTIDGAFAIKEHKLLGWYNLDELRGLTWVEPDSNRGPLILYSGGEIQSAVVLENPNAIVHPRVRNGKAEFSLDVKLSGSLILSMTPLAEAEIEREAEEKIRKQIRRLYDEGLKRDADLLRLEPALYRQKNREWKTLRSHGGFELTPESLKDIRVKVMINRTGNIKDRTRRD